MALQPLDPAVMEESQRELKDKLLAGSAVPQANVETIRQLGEISRFEYPADSGYWFNVKVVPYTDGLKLKDLFQRLSLSRIDTDSGIGYEIYERQLREMLDIAWKLSQPETRWMKIAKRLFKKYNPFIAFATEGDVQVLLGFFLVRRMMSNVRFHYPAI